jgi:hypothetical protein
MIAATLAPFGALYHQRRFGLADPKTQARRNAAEEAANVRALADQHRLSNPSFASDLYAAADRHLHEHETA